MHTLEIITSTEALTKIEPEWKDLFERCPGAPPFLHPGWQGNWWSVFGGAPLCTLAVRAEARLVALAVCFLFDQRLVFVGNGLTDQQNILSENEPAAGFLIGQLRAYGLDLQEIPEGSPLLEAF